MKTQDKKQPQIVVPHSIDVPSAAETTLSNGIRLYTLDCSDQDVVRVSFIFRAGSSLQAKPFCASATANLLSEGSTLHSAHQIAEELDFYGSYYDVSMDRDYTVITFASLSKFFDRTMELAREILLMPAFPEHELETYRAKRKQRLAVERSKPSFRARELFGQALFGDGHPYGVSYSESEYDNLTRDDIAAFYRERYTAGNCFVVCSGKVGAPERDAISTLASEIPAGNTVSLPRFPAPRSTGYLFGKHDNAVQSAIRIGRRMFTRSHPDFIPMQVVSTVLGGYFGSRLVRNLREERGYTYGVFSTMVNMEYEGYLAIATEVAAEVTADAIDQIFGEMERLCSEPVGTEELDMVKNIMTGEVMRILDGPFGIADVTIENVENGTDNRYLDRFLDEIRAITPEKVLDMARKYLVREEFSVVIVGDDENRATM